MLVEVIFVFCIMKVYELICIFKEDIFVMFIIIFNEFVVVSKGIGSNFSWVVLFVNWIINFIGNVLVIFWFVIEFDVIEGKSKRNWIKCIVWINVKWKVFCFNEIFL